MLSLRTEMTYYPLLRFTATNSGEQTVAPYRGLSVSECVCVTVPTYHQSRLIIHDSLVSDERYFPTFTLVRKNIPLFT